jgi:hypothetical protein
MSWRDCFAAAFAALDRGDERARHDLERLARSASSVLDTMMPSTAPDAIQQAHRVASGDMASLMAAHAVGDLLQREQLIRTAYASHGGAQSAATRRRKGPALKQWQKDIQAEALRMLRTTKMSAAQIAVKLAPKAPNVQPDTIRKFVTSLRVNSAKSG